VSLFAQRGWAGYAGGSIGQSALFGYPAMAGQKVTGATNRDISGG